jgi:hypothetical protein
LFEKDEEGVEEGLILSFGAETISIPLVPKISMVEGEVQNRYR